MGLRLGVNLLDVSRDGEEMLTRISCFRGATIGILAFLPLYQPIKP